MVEAAEQPSTLSPKLNGDQELQEKEPIDDQRPELLWGNTLVPCALPNLEP